MSGFRAEAVAPQRLRVSWQAQPSRFSGYRLAYRRVVEGQERAWSQDEIKEGSTAAYDLLPLEPNWTYELRLQGQSGSKYGPFTESIQVTMPPLRAVECDTFPKAKAPKSEVPLREAYPNMVVDAYGKEMTLIEAQMLPQEGWFSGSGYIRLAFTANLRSLVHFEKLYINEHRQAVRGMIHFARRPVPPVPVPEEESTKPEEETPAPINPSARWPGVVFHNEILRYEGFAIDSIAYDEGSGGWRIYHSGGELLSETSLPALLTNGEAEAVVVEDSGGDQWVVHQDGQVEEVKGGGIRPGENNGSTTPTSADITLLREAIRQLRASYPDERLDSLRRAYEEQTRMFSDQMVRQGQEILNRLGFSGIRLPSSNAPIPDSVQVYLLWQGESSEPLPPPVRQSAQPWQQTRQQYHLARIIEVLARPGYPEADYQLLSTTLQVQEQSYETYLAQARAQGLSEQVIIQALGKALLQWMEPLINKH
ncbi:MAG: fibronectin type III domain-containing protein [Bacteroidia bacterium]|nr:fibronectin type III domain-containing protein [Bacteroidia bacterium]